MKDQHESAVQREVDRYSMADPTVLRCPHAYYAAMRRESPVHLDPGTGFWWVANHDAVVAASMDPVTFSSKSPLVIKKNLRPRAHALWDAAGMQMLDTFVTADPPEHDDYRALGLTLFNQRKVDELAPAIERRVHEIIDALGSRTECDFVADFANWLPSSIVCDEFGFPPQDRQRFKGWTDSIFGLMVPGISEDEEVTLVRSIIELFHKARATRAIGAGHAYARDPASPGWLAVLDSGAQLDGGRDIRRRQ
jgi:cytochrome P450